MGVLMRDFNSANKEYGIRQPTLPKLNRRINRKKSFPILGKLFFRYTERKGIKGVQSINPFCIQNFTLSKFCIISLYLACIISF